MKVIDLLNKIANGEIPKTILYENETYWYDARENNYYTYIARDLDDEDIEYLFYGDNTLDMLEDEIVIIEEDKKIRKLDFIEENTFSKRQNGMTSEDRRLLDSNFKEIGNKINEIIDYLEENKKC